MIIIENIKQLPEKTKTLINLLTPLSNIWAFYALMGTGKTTIIKEICKQFNVEDTVTSPTFSIINEYITKTKDIIYHFDFYRLNHINEAISIGVPDYLESGNLCLIEWPTVIEPLLPQNHLKIKIETDKQNRRIIEY